MTSLTTSRFALPLLAAGQADKELTHNEALTLINMLLHPVVQGVGLGALAGRRAMLGRRGQSDRRVGGPG